MKYIESVSDLENRIRAHKLFSRTSLEKVLETCLGDVRDNSKIMDLGCGSGNFYELFSCKARCYIGIDISKELLSEFSSKRKPGAVLINSSMDDLPLFQRNSFDVIFSVYSIYYSLRPESLVENLHSSLGDGGHLFVVGPSKAAHATEINEFCSTIADGNAPAVEKNTRLDNFHSKIIPEILQRFSVVNMEEADGSLYFPSSEEWAKYVSSTPQVRECSHLNGPQLMARAVEYSASNSCLSISKYMTVVAARK